MTDRKMPPRAIALVGPYQSGKTTLLESILAITGAVPRKGSVKDGSAAGDRSAEARTFLMGVEAQAATITYLDDRFTFIDCPGSIEVMQDTLDALTAVDAAVVLADPDPAKAWTLAPLLHHLDAAGVPHFLFVNKIDKASARLRDLLTALQKVSQKPLVLRQIPIWQNGVVTGYVDLASERAYVYREHAASEIIGAIPSEAAARKSEARFHMLEQLADYDDHLMEELLADIEPPRDEIFNDLARELRDGLIVPVLIGSAEGDNGVRRLLKALRHETPGPADTLKRLGLPQDGDALVTILKTWHTSHGGKLSLARVLRGILKDGQTLTGPDGHTERAGGLFHPLGQEMVKTADAPMGSTVAIGRLDQAQTGASLSGGKGEFKAPAQAERLFPVYGLALVIPDRKDEVKLSGALHKLIEEDPSLSYQQNADTHEMVLWGQGEVHLKIALAKLKNRFGLTLETHPPKVPYKEAIRSAVQMRGRHKRQSGGHGQFGDVLLEIRPLERGQGFIFEDKIVGGVVPRQYIPGVEIGVKDGLEKGPLGFPVVDIAVALLDGSYHSVDSSEMAFRQAARIAMSDALAKASPVLLEPVMAVDIAVPSEATPRVNGIVSQRRGQLLGFDAREGWPGWDLVRAHLPQSELQGLIVDLRSATQGLGSFTTRFDHLAELTGKLADQVIKAAGG